MDLNIKTKATIEDYMQLPEGAHYQLVEGNILEMPSPIYIHQKISSLLFGKLFNQIYNQNKGEILSAPMDVHLGYYTIVQPDIIFIDKSRLHIIDKYIFGAPDVIIEIISKSNSLHYIDLTNAKIHTILNIIK